MSVIKANHFEDCQTLEQIPNIGPAIAGDLRLLGISKPAELRGSDAFCLDERDSEVAYLAPPPAAQALRGANA